MEIRRQASTTMDADVTVDDDDESEDDDDTDEEGISHDFVHVPTHSQIEQSIAHSVSPLQALEEEEEEEGEDKPASEDVTIKIKNLPIMSQSKRYATQSRRGSSSIFGGLGKKKDLVCLLYCMDNRSTQTKRVANYTLDWDL